MFLHTWTAGIRVWLFSLVIQWLTDKLTNNMAEAVDVKKEEAHADAGKRIHTYPLIRVGNNWFSHIKACTSVRNDLGLATHSTSFYIQYIFM